MNRKETKGKLNTTQKKVLNIYFCLTSMFNTLQDKKKALRWREISGAKEHHY